MHPAHSVTAPATDSTERLTIVFLALVAAVTLSLPMVRVPLWLEQPNEGWNAIHTLHAFTRQLYPAQPLWIINNYPPLSFYIVGALTAVTGDPVLAGRAIALISFAAITGAIALALRHLGGSNKAALVAALCFVAMMSGLFSLYVGLDDPQILAHAIVTLSVAALLGTTRRRIVVLAALGVVCGLLVKQIVIGLPFAATLWLAWHRRAFVIAWIATGALAASLALGFCVLTYGQPFLANMTFPRVLSWARFRSNAGLVLKPIVSLAAFGWLLTQRTTLRDPAIGFVALAIGGGLIEIVLFGGALGVGINIAFDLVIAAAMATGLVFDRLSETAHPARWRALLVMAIGLRVIAGAPTPLNPFAIRPYVLAQQADVEKAVAILRTLPGPIACEPLSTCAWAGHASVADLWKLRFENTIGRFVDTAAFFEAIKQRRFTAVVTAGNLYTPADDKFMPGLHDALHAAYGAPIEIGPSFYIFLRRPD